MSATVKTQKHFVRWMIRRDMPAVLRIEQSVFAAPWLECEFLERLRQRNCIGMVAENDDQVVGFMMYELHRDHLRLLDFAVHPNRQRDGVGTAMVEKLKSKLSPFRRTRLVEHVRETNLDAQRFFRAMGFKAVRVERAAFEDTGEDAYVMEYRIARDQVFDYAAK